MEIARKETWKTNHIKELYLYHSSVESEAHYWKMSSQGWDLVGQNGREEAMNGQYWSEYRKRSRI